MKSAPVLFVIPMMILTSVVVGVLIANDKTIEKGRGLVIITITVVFLLVSVILIIYQTVKIRRSEGLPWSKAFILAVDKVLAGDNSGKPGK